MQCRTALIFEAPVPTRKLQALGSKLQAPNFLDRPGNQRDISYQGVSYSLRMASVASVDSDVHSVYTNYLEDINPNPEEDIITNEFIPDNYIGDNAPSEFGDGYL